MKITYQIQGMHCQSCVDKIKNILVPIAHEVEVTLHPPQVTLTQNAPSKLEEVNELLASIGNYQAIPESMPEQKSWLRKYYPLLLIIAYITGVSLLNNISSEGLNIKSWMNQFMAGFFLVFSAFKLLDLQGFAQGYSSYDLLARRCQLYGYIYPFLELSLGLLYLLALAPTATNLATIIIMGFSSLGVIKALLDKRAIRCACLGTVLNVPLSNITLVEDLAMVFLAMLSF